MQSAMEDVEPAAPGAGEGSTGREVEGLRAALAAARKEADARGEQLELAKEKAKAIVRKQMERARAEEKKMQERADKQQQDIERLTARVKELETAPSARSSRADAKTSSGATSGDTATASSAEIGKPARRIAALRELVLRYAETAAREAKTVPPVAEETSADGKSTEVKSAEDESVEEKGADALSAVDGGEETAMTEARVVDVVLAPELVSIADELQEVEGVVRSLADDFLAAQTAAAMLQEDGRAQSFGSARALAETRAEAQSLRSRVAALQAANKAKSRSTVDEAELKAARDAKAVLEAKVSTMDALLTEKQAEVGKVRDKAREFLKNMSADKKAMELRMKEEIAVLKQNVDMLQGKVASTEQHASTLDSELENCLALVSEKQKTIQMLNMALSTERESAANVAKEMAVVRGEFAKYKEKARVALEERDARLEKSHAAVHIATEELRAKLRDISQVLETTRVELAESQKGSTDAKILLDRAVRAETALELERSSADTESNMHAGKVKKLEESIEHAKQIMAENQARAEDAEERLSVLSERMQAAKSAASAAEARSIELEKTAELDANKLREKIAALEASLHKSVESASAAQRVAAVAARALSEPTETKTPHKPNGNVTPSPRASPLEQAHRSRFSTDEGLGQLGSSSLAAVMSSHSLSLGLTSPNMSADMTQQEVDNAFRDQQMAVLTSQLSELGTLLDDAQEESQARAMQTSLLKQEVRELEAKLSAAEKLQNGAPFSYLRSIVVRYLETKDVRLLPVLGEVLSISKEELQRIREGGGGSLGQQQGFFSLPFLGRG